MPKPCSCCVSPNRAKIDRAIARNEPERAIAGRYAISRQAIQRHRAHVGSALMGAAARRGEKIGDSTLDGLRAVQTRLWGVFEAMRAEGDSRGQVAVLREARELLMALDGVLARAPAPADSRPTAEAMTSAERRGLMVEQLRQMGHSQEAAEHVVALMLMEDGSEPPPRARRPALPDPFPPGEPMGEIEREPVAFVHVPGQPLRPIAPAQHPPSSAQVVRSPRYQPLLPPGEWRG